MERSQSTKFNIKESQYQLVEVDFYDFRRAYYGHDSLEGERLSLFMNRNPESNSVDINSKNHPYYNNLSEIGIFKGDELNIKEIDTLPDQFDLQISKHKYFQVNVQYLENPKEVETPSYELTFTDNKNIILIDTLIYDWPPDVVFMKADLDEDGTEELLSIYRWYIVNGDNFDLKIYQFKNKNN